MTKGPMTVPVGAAKIEALLGLPRGTVRAARKLGGPITPEAPGRFKAWLDTPRAPWPAPFDFLRDERTGVSRRTWALVRPEEVHRVVPAERVRTWTKAECERRNERPGHQEIVKLCTSCMSEWAPSSRWQRIGPHFRARQVTKRKQDPTIPAKRKQDPTIPAKLDYRLIDGPEVTIACGACLGRVARVWLPDYRGLLTLHPDVPEGP